MPILIGIIVCIFLIILRELEKSETRKILDKAKDMSFINKGLEYYQRKQQLNRELSMTREEAIKKLESLKISLPAAKSEISEIVELLKSPWISIKDDLPCNHKELTPKDYTVEVLTLDDCNSYSVVRMWKFHDKWVWGLDDLPITHWMRLPELPKE